jgi:hypothetical protein
VSFSCIGVKGASPLQASFWLVVMLQQDGSQKDILPGFPFVFNIVN